MSEQIDKALGHELFMALANVTSCLVGLDCARPEGRVYKKLAEAAFETMQRAGPIVGAAPEWWDGEHDCSWCKTRHAGYSIQDCPR